MSTKIWSGGSEAASTARAALNPGVPICLKFVSPAARTHRPAFEPVATQTHRRAGRVPPSLAVQSTSLQSSVRVEKGVPATFVQSTSTPGEPGRWKRPTEVAATTVVPPGSKAIRLMPAPSRFLASRVHGSAALDAAGPWATSTPIPPSAIPGWAFGVIISCEVSPVPTKTSSSASAAPNCTCTVPQELRCAGRLTSGVFVGAKPPSERQLAPPSLEYQMPPLPEAA